MHLSSAKKIVPKILRMGAERILPSFLVLFSVALLIVGLVWYWSLQSAEIDLQEPGAMFHQDRLLEIIRFKEDRDRQVQNVLSKEYQDIFFSEE